ncbi:hypothetical protein ACJ73_08840 [Blastomyces percursus]|uniref:Chromo domain-containing protein n=1 Tax=Blastomyces percursus TaxID=1658174 RepID=A0A1J9QNS1_9EURO|nr:hypothetical protein ACJ73_08840 [Blastomyces percursus]
MNGKDSVTTGVSPFFLIHGYNLDPLQLEEDIPVPENPRNPIEEAQLILAKLKDAATWAQASMASAQQEQELQANRHRNAAPEYKVDDTVWLSLKNVSTLRPSRKLDVRNGKFKVIEEIGSHAYRLNTPPGIHNVFHVDLLRSAAEDPLPSQIRHEPQPPAIDVDGHEEYYVEKILDEKIRYRQKHYLVKWMGWTAPTWVKASLMEETQALDDYLRRTAEEEEEGGNVRG